MPLVLTRRPGEVIRLMTSDGEITLTLTRASGSHARISIDAPRNVEIVRGELLIDLSAQPAAQ